MGYSPSHADPDFWIRNCGSHYEYIATYVNDVLCFGRDPMAMIMELKRDYILKGIGCPEYYLGCNIKEVDDTWKKENIFTALSPEMYVRNVTERYE